VSIEIRGLHRSVLSLTSRFYDFTMRLASRQMEPRRAALVSEAAGRVLELGVGTGLNLPFYGSAAKVVGVERDPAMLEGAIPRAAAADGRVAFVMAAGERLPFLDGAFDQVVVSLVLCSVGSPADSLAELKRVLKPGGTLRFYEHVRSDSPAWAAMQDVITPVWKVLAEGCCPNRATVESIQQAGFEIQTMESFKLGPYPIRPQVLGTASRG
jgi:ubiquinone/menaquinone biosynthesis C-methylase UbiE